MKKQTFATVDNDKSETSSATMLTLDNISVTSNTANRQTNTFQFISSNIPNIMPSSNKILSAEELKLREEMVEVDRRRKLIKTVPIPPLEKDVKMRLRELGLPICLFGEKEVDRRQRLTKEVTDRILKEGSVPEIFFKSKAKAEGKIEENELFYTEGDNELRKVRMEIAKYSIPRSAFRIEAAKKKFQELDRIQESLEYESFLQGNKNFEFISSQFADERGCSRGSLSPNDKYYAVAGWSGLCTVFDIPNLNKVTYLKGHSDKVNCVTFHPKFEDEFDPIPQKGPNVATASNDGTIKLWSFIRDAENQLCRTFSGHEDRVNMVEFHPMGNYLASTSHDKTWRLWDVISKKEILLQEGHNAAVYPLSFQKDGALIATGDLAGIGIIWDLRSGRSVMSLQGHVKQMITIKFSPNCYQVLTGSDDNTLKVWDIRRRMCTHTIPAHNAMVSDVTFEHSDAKFLLTCSYDSTFKLWNNRDWSIVKTFSSTSQGKLTSIALTKDNQNVITSSLDRTVKLWTLNLNKQEEREDNNVISDVEMK